MSAVEASLRAAGFKVTSDSVAGRRAVIGRSRRLFVLVAVFKAGMAGREHLDRFCEEACQYASTVKGRLTGGATAVAVAVVEAGGRDNPGDWATAVPARGQAFPVLVDLTTGTATCPQAPADLRRLVQTHVGAASVRMV
jgi:hypothetical protein